MEEREWQFVMKVTSQVSEIKSLRKRDNLWRRIDVRGKTQPGMGGTTVSGDTMSGGSNTVEGCPHTLDS